MELTLIAIRRSFCKGSIETGKDLQVAKEDIPSFVAHDGGRMSPFAWKRIKSQGGCYQFGSKLVATMPKTAHFCLLELLGSR